MSWRVWVDTGGTFTDCVAVDPLGTIRRAKVLSSGGLRGRAVGVAGPREIRVEPTFEHPAPALRGARLRVVGLAGNGTPIERFDRTMRRLVLADDLGADERTALDAGTPFEVTTGEPAPVLAARLVTETPAGEPLPPVDFRLATTRATNALLERRYPRTALFVTRGFTDVLRIGDQRRPDLFALDILRPKPLTEFVYPIDERIGAEGEIVRALDEGSAHAAAHEARAAGCEVAAVALVNSWRNRAHEDRVCEIFREAGFSVIVGSAALVPRIRHLVRAQTAALEAALSPVLRAYADDVARGIGEDSLRILTSAGSAERAEAFHPVDGLLSGPAGGVVGALRAGAACSRPRVISFDMGGTSTDVARGEGTPTHVFEHEVGGVRVARRALAIETVAAGGGSVCSIDAGRPKVGPESAGAMPGPACYGADGPLTLTDVNLLLGRLDPDRFEIPVNAEASRDAAYRVIARLPAGDDAGPDAFERALAGFLELADERMAAAIRRISIQRGYDPASHALVAFGGAGPQHACAVAQRLGVRTVIVPRDASLLSAVGLGTAPEERVVERQCMRTLEENAAHIQGIVRELEQEARTQLEAAASAEGAVAIAIRRLVSARLTGQDHALDFEIGQVSEIEDLFRRRYRDTFGYDPPDRGIEVEAVRVTASRNPTDVKPAAEPVPGESREAAAERRVFLGGEWRTVPRHLRERLPSGFAFEGPAVVSERRTETLVPAGWRGVIHETGALVLTATDRARAGVATTALALEREIAIHRLSAVAEDMGEALARAAVSPNVKDRLDFSCGVLDPEGRLVASAPHLPVHLGALGHCVRRVIETLGTLEPGDVVVTNHPAFGGSHLPDVTVIQPVHTAEGELVAHVASRAHHAEIGGSAPGSMPATATTLAEEGIAIEPMYLFRRGEARWEEMERLLRAGSHPSRAVEDNLADLRAAVAGGRRGAGAILAILAETGRARTNEAMRWIIEHSAALVRDALAALPEGVSEARDALDDGAVLCVRITAGDAGATIDFTGSGPQHPGNLNAPLVVTRSAVAYVLRLLLDCPVPLNDGLLAPVRVVVPEGTMLNPRFEGPPVACPAVAGGNVETSQRVVDLLIRALGLAAGSQATMNNLLIGNERFGSYETICGGAGATARAPGAEAVHTHMTNTAITDVEVLERRSPLRVERFELRRGSGGAGLHRGGDGVIREIRALEPVEATLLSQRRHAGGFGLEGGGSGAPGTQRIVRTDGTREHIPGVATRTLRAGDRIVVETPGGGGWGAG